MHRLAFSRTNLVVTLYLSMSLESGLLKVPPKLARGAKRIMPFTLAHNFQQQTLMKDALTDTAPASNDSTGQLTVFMTSTGCTVLRGTAEVHVTGKNGTFHLARALIDPAAEASFIIESLADSLMLDEKAIVDVFGVADQFSGTARARASCMVRSTSDRSVGIPVFAWIMPNLSNLLPK
ncbi:hypothetical protein TKK_0012455 [Trichogramma kaykai]